MAFNSKLKFYWNRLPLKNYIYLAFGINIFLILAVLVFRAILPPQVPLFYGEPVGERQLVGSVSLLLAPLFALTVIFINTFIASKIDDIFAKKVLIVSSLFVSILVFITLTKIFFLIGTF